MDVITLHVRITDVMAHILAFVEEFDTDAVGPSCINLDVVSYRDNRVCAQVIRKAQ